MTVVRKIAADDKGMITIMAGGVRSHAAVAASTGLSSSCPHCDDNCIGTLDHVVWHCSGLHGRPTAQPADNIQARLGWPTGRPERARMDREILSWFHTVRRTMLDVRHGRGTTGGNDYCGVIFTKATGEGTAPCICNNL